jgi:hypothetical protein
MMIWFHFEMEVSKAFMEKKVIKKVEEMEV